MFWGHLLRLSRDDGVTIFVSTHFMNEAERCDRISLMDRGRVLAVGTPAELTRQYHAQRLEDAFIAVLEDNSAEAATAATSEPAGRKPDEADNRQGGLAGWLGFAWAFSRREAIELARDRIRMGFALAGPIILLCICAFSISFDVQNIRMAVLDHDQSATSRDLIRRFEGSRYFVETRPIASEEDAHGRLREGSVQMVLDIPPAFGRDLAAGRKPDVGVFIDGASPFLAANIQGYADAIILAYSLDRLGVTSTALAMPASIEPRFIYNQDFRSIYAITPGVLMLTMILIPAMLTALGIVREKEIGSIINLYASPAGAGAFLIGKQVPYVALAMVSYGTLVALIVTVLGVPLKGSLSALTMGALLFVLASTGLGMMISTFVRTQVAAIFATALICLIPSVNFSGLLYPVSTLLDGSYWIGVIFPSSWFQIISLGTFTKGLGPASFGAAYLALGLFALIVIMASRLMLGKQEV